MSNDGAPAFGRPADQSTTLATRHVSIHGDRTSAEERGNVTRKSEDGSTKNEYGTRISECASTNIDDVTMTCTRDELKEVQRSNPEIGPIIEWLENGPEQPPWDNVALKSTNMKTLW